LHVTLVSAFAEHYYEEGLADDPKVPAQRQVLDVIEVELDHPFVTEIASPANLPGSGEARDHVEATFVRYGVGGVKQIAIAKLERPRANQAHLSPKYVEQLGKLVQAITSQERTQPGDSGVVTELEQDATSGFIAIFQISELLFGVDGHCPELEYLERAAPISSPPLPKQDRTG
jgi:hypothetical protein